MNNIVHDVSMVSSGVTITTSFMLWFGTNATAIGAITAILMLILTAVFQILNYQLNKKRLEFDRRKKSEQE